MTVTLWAKVSIMDTSIWSCFMKNRQKLKEIEGLDKIFQANQSTRKSNLRQFSFKIIHNGLKHLLRKKI